jgi:hypothetical protein
MSYLVTIPMVKTKIGQCDSTGITSSLDSRLRDLITKAIKRNPKSRTQIADALTAMLGIRVTTFMLNDFTSATKKGVRFPLLFSAALCEVLDDDEIGLFAVRPRIKQLIQFAECELAGLHAKRELDALRERLLLDESVGQVRKGLTGRNKDRVKTQESEIRQTALPLREPE